MIAPLSPLTRRIVAIGLLVLLALGLLNLLILPLGGLVAGQMSDLADARFQLARLEAIAARPAPRRASPVPADLAFVAPDRSAARDLMGGVIAAAAARVHVQVEIVPENENPADASRALGVTIHASGPQDGVLAFLNQLERGRPLIRLRTWSLASVSSAAPLPPGAPGAAPVSPPAALQPVQPVQVRLDAVAVAVWERPS